MAARTSAPKGKKDEFFTIKLISCPIRLSYPHLFDPAVNDDNGKETWETAAFVPPNKAGDKFLDDLEDALHEVMTKAWGPEDTWPSGKNDSAPADKIKKIKQETLDKIGNSTITTKWHQFTARSYSPVGVVDADKAEVLNKREAYGGRWARLSVTISPYDNKSKGVTIYLNNVQLLDNDESFGGRPAAERDFDEWQGEDLAPGGRRRRDSRDDDDAGRGGRDRGDRTRDDDRQGRGSRAGGDRDERSSGRDDAGDRGRGRDSRDEDAPRGRDRDADRGRDRDEGRDDRRGAREDRGGRDRDDGGRRPREDEEKGYRGRDRHSGDDALEKEDRRIKDERDSRGRGSDRDRSSDRGQGERERDAPRSREEGTRGRRDEAPEGGRGETRGRDSGRDRGGDDRDAPRDRSGGRDEDERRPSERGRRDERDDEWN